MLQLHFEAVSAADDMLQQLGCSEVQLGSAAAEWHVWSMRTGCICNNAHKAHSQQSACRRIDKQAGHVKVCMLMSV